MTYDIYFIKVVILISIIPANPTPVKTKPPAYETEKTYETYADVGLLGRFIDNGVEKEYYYITRC